MEMLILVVAIALAVLLTRELWWRREAAVDFNWSCRSRPAALQLSTFKSQV